jgi:hypothetical protein
MLKTLKAAFTPINEQAIIAEIHNAFDTAEDRLLVQAQQLLDSIDVPKESDIEKKAERLSALGFNNTQSVKQASTLKEKRQENETLVVKTKSEAELINYYKFTYPFLKFLTEEELDKICTKYNLIYAPVGNYKEDVPDKNIGEIEKAQSLKLVDNYENVFSFSENVHGGDEKLFLSLLGKKEAKFTQKELKYLLKKYYGNDIENWTDLEKGKYEGTCFFAISQRLEGMVNTVSWRKMEGTNKTGLFIAAPQSHFNLKGLSKKSKFGFFNVTVQEVKDPIVFRYVKGGIQVLSKWGLEASDEALVVDKLN